MCRIHQIRRENPMGHSHPSTPAERAQWATQMLAHDHEYGFISHLSSIHKVSRPTLYAWKARAAQALQHAFDAPSCSALVTPSLARHILTLLLESHASYANIQVCLCRLTGLHVSIGTIAGVVAEAQQRALEWMASHAPASSRSLALDEIYANNRRGAYLNVVDSESWAVWAAEGPLSVDAESWTLVLWYAQERGLNWHSTISDGGDALRSACLRVDPIGRHARDHWHLFHTLSQVYHRIARQLQSLHERTATVERQAARIAEGKKPRGGKPKTDLLAHLAEVAEMERCVAELRAWGSMLRDDLAVVVVTAGGVLDAAQRECELATGLELLSELLSSAPSSASGELKRLQTQLRLACPAMLLFVEPLDRLHHSLEAVLGQEGLALIGWAYLRRKTLGWDSKQLLAALPQGWRDAARVLLHAWQNAPRASSAVENWHSILRPHLAVHRELSAGMLALLAVWHNHRVFTRGVHKGHSPLKLSGMEAPSDWLVALGYPPADGAAVSVPHEQPASVAPLALAA
jgi:hypothetical protein